MRDTSEKHCCVFAFLRGSVHDVCWSLSRLYCRATEHNDIFSEFFGRVSIHNTWNSVVNWRSVFGNPLQTPRGQRRWEPRCAVWTERRLLFSRGIRGVWKPGPCWNSTRHTNIAAIEVKIVLREFSLVLFVCGVLAVAPSTRLHLGRTGSTCKKTGFCSNNLNRSMENQCGFLNKKNQQPEKQMVFAKKVHRHSEHTSS